MARQRIGGLCLFVILTVFVVGFLMIFSGNVFSLQRYTLLPEEEQGSHYRKEHGRMGVKHSGGENTAHMAPAHEGVKHREKGPIVRSEATIPLVAEKRGRVTEEERLKTFAPTPPRTTPLKSGHMPSHAAGKMPVEHPAKAPHAAATAAGHEAPMMAEHEEDHVVLPQISPIPGVTFVETMIRLMEHELKGRFLGWRPNDLIIGRFTDNINNFQLGVLEAMRFTTLRLKDSLTRMGEADAYDRDLEDALNLLMNKATEFWFPSAESSYSEAIDHLKKFLKKLKTGERRFYYRTDNLLALIVSYSDLLGNVNRTLIMDKHADGRPVSWFETDDYFYYAKGVAHVMYEILKVVRVGFKEQLVTIDAVEIMDHILHELHRAEKMDPWIVLDSDLDGLFANHRANLNAPLSEATHLMSVMSRF